MLEVATGQRPFWWLTDSDLMLTRYTTSHNAFDLAVASGHLRYITDDFKFNAGLKDGYERLMRLCLSDDPDARPDVPAVLSALEELPVFDTAMCAATTYA